MKQPAGFRWRRNMTRLRNVRDFSILFTFLGLAAFGSGLLIWLAAEFLAGVIKV